MIGFDKCVYEWLRLNEIASYSDGRLHEKLTLIENRGILIEAFANLNLISVEGFHLCIQIFFFPLLMIVYLLL